MIGFYTRKKLDRIIEDSASFLIAHFQQKFSICQVCRCTIDKAYAHAVRYMVPGVSCLRFPLVVDDYSDIKLYFCNVHIPPYNLVRQDENGKRTYFITKAGEVIKAPPAIKVSPPKMFRI